MLNRLYSLINFMAITYVCTGVILILSRFRYPHCHHCKDQRVSIRLPGHLSILNDTEKGYESTYCVSQQMSFSQKKSLNLVVRKLYRLISGRPKSSYELITQSIKCILAPLLLYNQFLVRTFANCYHIIL
jgi:hypothetical protein